MALISTELSDGVAVLTLDDPDRRNALSSAMVDELTAAFDWLEHDEPCRAVIVTGAGPAFCAGADLGHLSGSREEGLRQIYEGFLRVARSPIPTIAAVNGAAVGAGMNLALACDVRVAGVSARFDTRFLQLGIHPGGGHTWMLRRLAGPQATHAMVVFGDVVNGVESVERGLTWRCVPDDDLVPYARELGARAASAPLELARRVKATIEGMAAVDDRREAVNRELVEQVWSMEQPEFARRLDEARGRITGR